MLTGWPYATKFPRHLWANRRSHLQFALGLKCKCRAHPYAATRYLPLLQHEAVGSYSRVNPLQEFSGRWVVEPGGSGDAPITTLRYEISLVPKLSIPSAALVYVVRSGLPANMRAVARRAEEVSTPSPCLSLVGGALHLEHHY